MIMMMFMSAHKWGLLHPACFLLLCSTLVQGQSVLYDFSGCSSAVEQIYGVSITSQLGQVYTENNLKCSARFMLPNETGLSFQLQLVGLDLPPAVDGHCLDSVTVWQTVSGNLDVTASKLLGPLCGSLDTANVSRLYADSGSHILMQWSTGSTVSSAHSGFHIILTAVLISHTGCPAVDYIMCSASIICLPSLLRCDGVSNCHDGSDEHNCGKIHNPGIRIGAVPSNNSTPRKASPPGSTTVTTTISQEDEMFQEVDMVSIIVVGVLFVVILMICIILACRSKGGDMEVLSEESNQLRLDVSSNPGYAESEGLPSTPPPTYSMIERQTSYVSQISMSSSQVSEPPDYDEALQIDSQGNPIPRRNSSRSSTGRHSSLRNTNGLPVRSASGYARSRPRVQRYNRSQSVTEGAPRSRYVSQASTISEIVPPDELSGLDNDETFIAGSIETSPDPDNRSSLPVTSTPHVLQSGYNIEMLREDSMAPLFRLEGTQESSEQSTSGSDPRMLGEPTILEVSSIEKTHDHVDDDDDDDDDQGPTT